MKKLILAILVAAMAFSAISATTPTKTPKPSKQVFDVAYDAINAIASRDYTALSKLAHPSKGILFAPYTDDNKAYLTFKASQIKLFVSSKTKYTWGTYDGSGAPIKMTPADYFTRFVYDKPYADSTQVGINVVIQPSNTADGMATKFAKAQFVEFYIPSVDPMYQGMDWGTLRIVIDSYNGNYYVVAIIHSQWTV